MRLNTGRTGGHIDRLIRACEAGKIKAVIVASLSRFARSVRFAENFFYELDQLGVMVCFADMPHYDGANRKDVMGRQFNEAIAEEQRKSIIEQLRKGREARARHGKIGGGTVPYGYIRLEVVEHKRRAKRVKINLEEANIVQLIFTLHDQGRRDRQIANTLNQRGYRRRNDAPWVPQQVSKILMRRELYAEGITRYGDASGRNPELILLKKKLNRL